MNPKLKLVLREFNQKRINNMGLYELTNVIILPQTCDEVYVEQVCERYFDLIKN
jgi:hypothetical protein